MSSVGVAGSAPTRRSVAPADVVEPPRFYVGVHVADRAARSTPKRPLRLERTAATIGDMPDRRSRTKPDRPPLHRTAAAVLVAAVLTGCQPNDCTHGTSAIELRVPDQSWTVNRFCIDDQCLPAAERQPDAQEPAAGTMVFYSYAIEVRDHPDTYRYTIDVTAPDGVTYRHDGSIQTRGNRMGGEVCEPTTANAALTVDADGELTKSP